MKSIALAFAGLGTASTLFALTTPREVEVRSFDGQALAATYFSPGRAGPAVIMSPRAKQCEPARVRVAHAIARRLRSREQGRRCGSLLHRQHREGVDQSCKPAERA